MVRAAWILAALVGLCAAGGFPAANGSPTSTEPEAPARTNALGEPRVRVDGFDYVDLDDFARRLDLHVEWLKPDERVRLKTDAVAMELTAGSREVSVNGLRVFLGLPTRWHRKALCVSGIDVDKVLGPLFQPGVGRVFPPRPVKTIVIDPGHGGVHLGTQNESLKLQEKTFTLDTAMRLKALLVARGYGVVLTRSADRELSPDWRQDLQARAEVANRVKADLFISVHYNATAENPQATAGVETIRYTPQNQTPSGRTERRASDEEEHPNDNHADWSTIVGFTVHRRLVADLGAVDRGLKHDKLAVLKQAACPAILVEGGFLSNEAEAKRIVTPEYRQRVAESIASAVDEYARTVATLAKTRS